MPFNVVSLFCGCGGGDLGLKGGFTFNHHRYPSLPFNCIFATDINEPALNTFKLNFPRVATLCADIVTTPATSIPACDIVIGGFPCQSFSTVNPTKDPFDARGNLYREMVRVVKAKQPMAFIAENVKGFMTLHNGQIFQTVRTAFQQAGYVVEAKLLKAVEYGVPQRRERVIMVGIRNDLAAQLGQFQFPAPTTLLNPVPLGAVVPVLAIPNQRYYFSQRAVQGMRNAKPNMKRGLAQSLNAPCLTVSSHLAKVSLNSRDPVLLVNPATSLYRRFTVPEAAGIQSFPDSFIFAGTEKDAYKQIGNAIPPVLFWHVGNALAAFLAPVMPNQNGPVIHQNPGAVGQ